MTIAVSDEWGGEISNLGFTTFSPSVATEVVNKWILALSDTKVQRAL